MIADELLQTMLRTAFGHCTTITIAHRLDTIADSDRVLVMDMGRIAEFDAPHVLLQKEKGLFRSMCVDSHAEDTIRQVAEKAYLSRGLVGSV